MKENIIDSDLIEIVTEESSLLRIYKKYKQLIPVLILTVCIFFVFKNSFWGIINEYGERSFLVLNIRHYGALLILILNYFFFFRLRKQFKYVLITTLILGLFRLLYFNSSEWYITFGKTPGPPLQPVFIGLIILELIINFKTLTNFLNERNETESKTTNDTARAEKIEKFKNKYRYYTSLELNTIIADPRYVTEAKEAAQQLVEMNNVIDQSKDPNT